MGVLILIAAGVFVHYYIRFSHLVDQRLSGQIFHHASMVLSAPTPVVPGEAMSSQQAVDRLRKALYISGGKHNSGVGSFDLQSDRLTIYPGPASFFATGQDREGPATLEFKNGYITAITSLKTNSPLQEYDLEPETITTLFGQNRRKRLLVTYHECPPDLVHAVLAAEDRRFFSHHGVNFFRLFAATVKDIRADKRLQGGSTLTMQLALNFFLTPQRTIKRKLEQIFLAVLLEDRLSKEEIFGMYANEIYMGQRGSFSIYGFGEAADSYFNKDIKNLTLPEAALLAGVIRGPNLYSPYHYPERALDRRNWVLREMARDHYISPQRADQAMHAPLGIARGRAGGSLAPYFVDMVRDELLAHFSEQKLLSKNYRVYTTLDPELQICASHGVQAGMERVEKRLKARRRKTVGPNEPQAALVVLDPQTGEVLALVGGRNYAASQLNHALALRQPGSSFKPFVYATALSSGVTGSQPLVTTETTLPDAPTTFLFGDQTYAPKNFKDDYYGTVTVREALALSLNVATVNLAQMVGYEKVKDLAMSAGINNGIQATPAIALGAYVATPLQMAGAYTIFANSGVYEAPRLILSVRDDAGNILWQSPEVTRQVLDSRVAYLMVSLMQSVIDHGTGAGARARGFTEPAAGKTGTSRDGWFAGFTSNLLAVAWVGYDNDQNLGLTGASSALPIWTAFMKDAARLPAYQNMQPFNPPLGVIVALVDSQTQIATANDPLAVTHDVFIDGTQPVSTSPASRLANLIKKILPFAPGKKREAAPGSTTVSSAPAASVLSPPSGQQRQQAQKPASGDVASPTAPPPKKPESVLKKFFSIFKHHHKTQPQQPAPVGRQGQGP
ncbi:MAG: transglycosylase domain-containing protein [Terriglobia bacterium]